MSSNCLRLLGAFQLVHHDETVALKQTRLEELIALLATRCEAPFTRRQIAYCFWPDSSERQARTNVRNLLHKLRTAWPAVDEALVIDSQQIAWRAAAGFQIDLVQFDALRAQVQACTSEAERIRLWTEIADLYAGDFLPACYADWALAERERIRGHLAEVLEQLIDAQLARRNYDDALRRSKQLHNHDPLRESAYRKLMQSYAALGDRAAALRTYHSCASILQKELGVEPATATRTLHAQLLRHAPPAPSSSTPRQIERPRLVGRHAEWRRLRQTWDLAKQGRATCVIIWGEAGIGKTRLAEELIDWVQRQGRAVASSRSYAVEGALTYAPISEWLAAPPVAAALAEIDDLWRVELARLAPTLLADRPDLPRPGPLTETWQQQRFFQSIAQTVRVVAGPLLLHLDDMQWSDPDTFTLLQYILHSAQSQPLLIMGGVRTEDAAPNVALAAFLEALRHQGRLVEIRLGALSQAETVELAQQTVGKLLPAAWMDNLYAASEGHPLFLIESLRAGADDRGQERDKSTDAAARAALPHLATVPPKIQQLISARLGQLSSTAQQIVGAAAVIGRAFTYPLLVETTDLGEMALIDALDELWARRIVREQDDDGYDFSHDRIREVAYQTLSRARRRLLHRRVANALATLHEADLNGVAGELAAHHAQSGDSDQACHFYRRAAQVALTQHALIQAGSLFQAALTHAPDDPALRIVLLHEQNRLFHTQLQMGRWQENLMQMKRSLAALPAPEPYLTIEVALDHSRFHGSTGDGARAVKDAQAALDIAMALADDAALARCYCELAHGYWIQSRMGEAEPLFGRAATYAHAARDQATEATSLEMQAATGMFSGMPLDKIDALLQRAYQLAEANDDRQKMAALLNKFGYGPAATGVGDFARIETHYRQGLTIAREIGDRRMEELLLSNLGVHFTALGDYQQALDSLRSALALAEAHPHYWRHQITRHYLGALMMQMGRLDTAHAILSEASDRLAEMGNRHFEVKARCDLGFCAHLAGDQRLAQAELARLLTVIKGHGDLRFEALICTRLGYVHEAIGQMDDAARMYQHGYDLHQRMGQVYYALNAQAGLARLAAHAGDGKAAYAHAQAIWTTIAGRETEVTVETTRTLRSCYALFQTHDDRRAAEILRTSMAQLRACAATIDDPDQVASFWQLDDRRFFAEMTAKRPAD